MQRDGIRGCGSDFAIPYFTTFVLIITFIALNLTIASVNDGLASARKDEGALISIEDIDTFIELWSDFDPKATGWISIDWYVFLIFELPDTIGLEPQSGLEYIYKTRKQQNEIETQIFKGEKMRDEKYLHGNKDIQIITDSVNQTRYFLHKKKNVLL